MKSGSVTLGEAHVTVLEVGRFDMSADVLFAGAPPGARAAALERHGLPVEPIPFRVLPLLIEVGDRTVVVDPGSVGGARSMREALGAVGRSPDDVDDVVITHGHADHYAGCVDVDGGPVFGRATHHLQAAEWAHWTTPDNPEPGHAETFRRLLGPLRARFTLSDGEAEVAPGVRVVPAPGHSPGQQVVVVADRLLHTGDAVLTVIGVEHPDWVASFELWPEQVVATRRRLLGMAADAGLLVVLCHTPFPGLGRVERDDAGFRWAPVDVPRA